MKCNMKLGISLEHFSEDFVRRKVKLEDLIKIAAKRTERTNHRKFQS